MLRAELSLSALSVFLNKNAIMAGAAILGAALGAANSGLQYFLNKKTAEYNLDLSEQAAQNEYQRQLEFWGMQNNYNLPSRQAARMFDAGLSPVEATNSGNAQGLSSVPGNEVAKNGALEAPQIDLVSAMKQLQEIQLMGKQGSILDEELSQEVVDTYLKSLEKQLAESGYSELAERIRGLRLNNDRLQRENDNLYTDEYYKKFLNHLKNTWSMTEDEAHMKHLDRKYYDAIGMHPDRAGSPRERSALLALDALLRLISKDKVSVRSLLSPGESKKLAIPLLELLK